MEPTRPRNACALNLPIEFAQRSNSPVRFRFDAESIRNADLAAFVRWLKALPANTTIDLEFEPSQPEFHALECPFIRRIAPALLGSIDEPFQRVDGESLPLLLLASLPDLVVMRADLEIVSLAFPIDGLIETFFAQYKRLPKSTSVGRQLDRMLEVSADLGLNADDWLEPADR